MGVFKNRKVILLSYKHRLKTVSIIKITNNING
jgi:hypothetical protein